MSSNARPYDRFHLILGVMLLALTILALIGYAFGVMPGESTDTDLIRGLIR